MINLKKLKNSSKNVNVEPNDRIFSELGNNTYVFNEILSEFIDNSLAARRQDVDLVVGIEFYINKDEKIERVIVKDNASGIPNEKLGDAISPAAIQTKGSLNEHGLGMKQAIAALGELDYLATKTAKEKTSRVIRELKFGRQDIFEADDFEYESGTEISIINPKEIVPINKTSITTRVVPYLGARYRRFLTESNPQMDLSITYKDMAGHIKNTWPVNEIKPIYFHPSSRKNQPVFQNYPLSGDGWNAKITFGYAPSDEELKELGLFEEVTQNHPYNVSINKQGLDVIMHDRIVLFHQLSELEITTSRHNSFNKVRGEIELIKGFSTAITKNSIIHDKHFRECITKIIGILNGEERGPGKEAQDYLNTTTYPDEIPEALLRDRLAKWLKNNPIQKRKEVRTEYVVQGIEGYIDILADREVWELKRDQADARSVYQLFMYMDVGNFKRGFLIAESFTTGAQVAAKHIKNKHGKEIQLQELSKFPIIHAPNSKERENYY